jgi:DNA-binding MarR family transcriptional regulator
MWAMADDFISSQGRAFLAHRLRRSSDLIVEQIGGELQRMGLAVPPRGASMLLLVDEAAPIGVVEISRRLRLSHPLIVRMAQQFQALGLVGIDKDPEDARRKRLAPTEKGRAEAKALRDFNGRLETMFGRLFDEIDCDVVAMLDRLQAALGKSPAAARLSAQNPEDRDED